VSLLLEVNSLSAIFWYSGLVCACVNNIPNTNAAESKILFISFNPFLFEFDPAKSSWSHKLVQSLKVGIFGLKNGLIHQDYICKDKNWGDEGRCSFLVFCQSGNGFGLIPLDGRINPGNC
jgi:hypothetical protein